jgi:hypothetical protein
MFPAHIDSQFGLGGGVGGSVGSGPIGLQIGFEFLCFAPAGSELKKAFFIAPFTVTEQPVGRFVSYPFFLNPDHVTPSAPFA